MDNQANKTKDQLLEDINILTDSEAKYRLMFENMINGVAYHKIVTDMEGKAVDYIFLEVNTAFEELTGLKAKEVIGKKVTEALPGIEKDTTDWIGLYGNVALNEKSVQFESCSEPLNKWYSINAYCPQKGYFITIFEDITKRKQEEVTIKFNEERYKGLFNSIRDSILVADTNRNIIDCNPVLHSLFGYTLEEIIGKPTVYLYENEDEYIELGKALKEHPGDQQFLKVVNYKKKSGEIFPGETNVFYLKDNNGDVAGFIGLIRDITDRKLDEQNKEETRERLEKIIKNTSAGYFFVDKEGIIKDANDAWVKLYKYDSKDEIINHHFAEIQKIDDLELAKTFVNEIMDNNPDYMTGEFSRKCKDDSIGFHSFSANPVYHQNEVVGIEGFIFDITERKKIENDLIHSHDFMSYVINHNQSAVAVHDKDLNYLFVSQRYLNDYKVKEKDVIGKHHYDVFPDLPQKWRDVHQKALAGEVSKADKDPYFKEDGTMEWTKWECRPWYDRDGTIGGIIIYTEVITDRKQAEEKLKENQKLLDKVGEIAKIGGWEMDLTKDGAAHWTKGTYDIIEIDPKEPIPGLKEHLDYYFPEYREMIGKKMNDIAETGKPMHFIAKAKTKKGNIIWVEALAEAVVEDNKVVKLRGTLQDITKEKNIKDSLRESQTFNETLLNTSPDIIYIYDIVESKNIYSNEGVNKILGYSIEEVQEMGNELIPSLMHEDDFKIYLNETYPRYQSTKEGELIEHEYRMKHKNGNWYWLCSKELIFKRNSDGSPKQIFGIISDITDYKEAQKKLEEEKNKAQQYLEIAEVILLSIDSDGVVQLVNPKGCEVLGYSEDEIIGKNWFDNFLPERLRKAVKEVSEKVFSGEIESVKYYENEILTKSGEEKIIAWHNSVLKDEKENIIGTLSSGQDITELKLMENVRQKFVMLVDSSSEFIGMCDLDMNPTYVNNAGMRMVGFPDMTAACQVKVEDYFFPEDQQFIKDEFFPRVLQDGEGEVEIRLRHFQTGDPIWMFYSLFNVRDSKGEIVGWATVSRDITEQKNAADKLKESEEKFRKLFQNTSLPLCYVDKDGIITLRNDRFIKTFGYTEDDVPSLKEWWIKAYPDKKYREWVVQNWESAVEEAEKTENDIISEVYNVSCKDGSIRNIIISGITIDGNFLATFIDITERKQAEIVLQNKNVYIESIMNNMPIGFGVNNIDDGEVKYLNKQFEDIYGWSKEILTNTSVFFEKVFPDPEYREEMKAQIISDMESGDPERMIWDNLKITTSSGEERIVKAYNIPLIDQNIMISTVQDVTELKLAEDELKKHRDHLEEIVETRTQQLEEKNKELDNALKVFVGRELTIRDLQRQLNDIKNIK
jgi:PAS domain S-box-containing protein